MRSMTGFAQGRFSLDNFSLNIVIRSLNHRYFDLSIKGSGISGDIESIIKDLIKDKISRGKIEVLVDFFDSRKNDWDIKFNDALLTGILDKVLYFKKRYKSELSLSLDSLLKIPMVFHLDQTGDGFSQREKSSIKSSIKKVLKSFIDSRESEGKKIASDIMDSIKIIESEVNEAGRKASKFEKEIYEKFLSKIKKYVSEYEIDKKRIVQEAALLAEKNCIAEELNRLKTHASRLKSLINNRKLKMKGKEADFLSQEMLRETSTISAKTGSIDIHDRIILVRREVEKIKQQVQNVE